MTDEKLLTAAKLAERVNGRLDGHGRLQEHAGLPLADLDRGNLSFLSDPEAGFVGSDLQDVVDETLRTRAATDAIRAGDASALSYLVGVTEVDLDASSLTATADLMDRLHADHTLTTVLGAGRPNTGKSNLMFLLLGDFARIVFDDPIIISNARSWTGGDETITSMHDLLVFLSDPHNRDRPKTFVLDEASRHMDARVHSRAVATQYSPAIKSFAKLGVEATGAIGHTGKDVDPECKRLTNLGFFKEEVTEVQFFDEWPGDSDRPTSPIFPDPLKELEPTSSEYDPDDVASWSWDLDPDVWTWRFEDWDEFHDRLVDHGRDDE